MAKILFCLISFVVQMSVGNQALAQENTPLVVLIPGIFNSVAPGSIQNGPVGPHAEPYFSQTIIDSLTTSSHAPYVVDNLSPLGDIADNGARLLAYIHGLQQDPTIAGRPMIWVAHSAGGLYALSALTQDPSLPVQDLITVATPFGGAELIDNISQLAPILNKIVDWVDLDALKEFKRANVAQFIAGVRIPSTLRIHTVASTQHSSNIFNWMLAEYLSTPMTLTAAFISEPSDGIIGQSSALGTNVTLIDNAGHADHPLEPLANANFSLEHWEQVLDSQIFTLLGIIDTGYVAQQQQGFYGSILSRLTAADAVPMRYPQHSR